MKNERDKFLTELIGECFEVYGRHETGTPLKCNCCLRPLANDFSTWEGFGKLKKFVENSEECYRIYDSYLDKIAENVNHVADTFERITPDSFADHVCDEFKFYGR